MRPVLVVVAVALVVASAAVASRKPTSAEQKAIRQAFTFFVSQKNSPAAKDNRLVSIAVSSLDPRYAVARLNSKSAGPSELVLHRSGPGWWIVGFGSSVNCNAGPPSVMRDLKVGCMPPNGVAWINNCGPLVSAPGSLVLACGDGNYVLANLKWRGWGTPTTTALGVAQANTCTPNCAAGHFRSYRMTATATKLSTCGKARYYATLTVVYPGARPAGVAKRDVHTLGC
jgi:hypothetical protein